MPDATAAVAPVANTPVSVGAPTVAVPRNTPVEGGLRPPSPKVPLELPVLAPSWAETLTLYWVPGLRPVSGQFRAELQVKVRTSDWLLWPRGVAVT